MKITNRIVSADDMIDADACYDDDKVRRLVPSPVPLAAILELDIPDVDKLWTLRLVLCPYERTWLAAQFARTALPYTDDERVLQCIETCERYAAGEATGEELRAAADAAHAAADAERTIYAALAARAAADAAGAANAAGAAAYAAANAAGAAANAAGAAANAAGAVYAAAARAARAGMLRIFKEALA